MPNKTFFNLAEEKRTRIIEAALAEFSTSDYYSASLNNIIKNADIPKGSMYQYFDNKKDLYKYIINLASDAKLSSISNTIKNTDSEDFFEILKQMHLCGLKFDLNNPKYSRLLYKAGNESNQEISDITTDIFLRADKYFQKFITEAQKNGEIRKDISLDFISFVISRLSLSIADYVSYKFDFSYEKSIQEGQGEIPVKESALEDILNDMTSILKKGLKQT